MASSQEAYQKARELVDEVHKRDPRFQRRIEGQAAVSAAAAAIPTEGLEIAVDDGTANAARSPGEGEDGQDELAYADAMEAWVNTLLDKAGDPQQVDARLTDMPGGRNLVTLAARCQHLERFATPRSSFPEGKAGYLQWRRSLYKIQADTAVELLSQAGLSGTETGLVHKWVSKTDLKPGKQGGAFGTQLLEDAAVMVFLQDQLEHFAKQHAEYPREKWIDILKKTWRKLSDEGKAAAGTLPMPAPLKELIDEATRDPAIVAS